MAKRRYVKRRSYRRPYRRRHRSKRIPLAATMGIASLFITPCPVGGRTILDDLKNGDFDALLYDAREKFAGIDSNGKFQLSWIVDTYTPVIVGGLVSKVAGRFVNRYFDKIPVIGKYLGA